MARCKNLKLASILSALLTRVMFSLHCIITLGRIYVSCTEWNRWYWLLFSGLGCLLLETIVTIWVRKGAEYKWFCPSVFFYLVTIVPCVWILELDLLSARINRQAQSNVTLQTLLKQLNNSWLGSHINQVGGINLPIIDVEPKQWVALIEQSLLFLLILGRWMLPKGKISRDELSQLLLVYIGMAADIIEFLEAFKEDMVKTNWTLTITILAIWSSSLFQFTLVLTASSSRKGRAGFSINKKRAAKRCRSCCAACQCCGTEVGGLMTTMILQDGPFVSLRLLLLVRYEVKSYMHIFFTVKNSLVLLLIVYRLFVLFENRHNLRSSRDTLDEISLEDDLRSRRIPKVTVDNLEKWKAAGSATGSSLGDCASLADL